MKAIGVRKVDRGVLAPPARPLAFLDRLPRVLAANALTELAAAVVEAVRHQDRVLWLMGAHVIKCGLAPVLIDLMQKGLVSHLAVNGAAIVHDVELALYGRTSEDVERGLLYGQFGQERTTAAWINDAVNAHCRGDALSPNEGLGLGAAIGWGLTCTSAPYAVDSLFAAAWKHDVPISVHVALGTDICHHDDRFDAARWGIGTMRDFALFERSLARTGKHGVVLHWGSAAILPEIFLKALANRRGAGQEFAGLTTANFDMHDQYRPRMQLVERVKLLGGRGHDIRGHHEIMLPLLAGIFLHELEERS